MKSVGLRHLNTVPVGAAFPWSPLRPATDPMLVLVLLPGSPATQAGFPRDGQCFGEKLCLGTRVMKDELLWETHRWVAPC